MAILPGTIDSADSAVPAPTASTAVVTIKIGGDRETASGIGPLQGAQFGLFRTKPEHWDNHEGDTTDTPAYTCVSDADGNCSFVVPIGSSGVPANTRLWAAPTKSPAGWFANPWWQTAPLTPSTGDPKISLRHVFQTPQLQAKQTYVSGTNWITDPGLQTSPAGTSPNYTRRIASGGVWPLSRNNPALPTGCGLRVAVVVDVSSSINGSVPQLKNAIGSFADALRGTPSEAALFTFGTDSPATPATYGANTSLMPMATTSDVNRFKALYANWPNNPPTNYTNWDRGLAAVAAENRALPAADRFDAAVMITDGNPTVYGPHASNSSIPKESGYTRFREVGNAVGSANELKAQGTRVLAVGVGAGLEQGAAYNLRSISGRDAYDGRDILDADYLQEANYASAGAALRSVVLASCAPSISVIKQVVPAGATDTSEAYTPSDPWTFHASTNTTGAAVTPASGSTSSSTGALNFDVDVDADHDPATFALNEDLHSGYTLFPTDGNGGAGTQNAVCVNKSEDDAPVPVTNASTGAGFTVDVGLQDALSCIVYNQEPPPPPLDPDASVVVHKSWTVTAGGQTTTYPNGEQPADLQSKLTLDGPEGAASSEQSWDVPREGYHVSDGSVLVGESPDIELPGCTLTEVTIDGATVSTESPSARFLITPGENSHDVVNHVTCVSHLTLKKRVGGGTASPDDWHLTALGTGGALAGPDGTDGVRTEVSPEATYSLAESHGTGDPALLNEYVQDDFRTRPLDYPDSSGSWSCTTADGLDTSGGEGAVAVPLGQDVTCTASNTTAQVTVIKKIDGGTASPSDFTFHLTPAAPHPEPLGAKTLAGSDAPGTTTTVRPGQAYTLRESGGPAGYELTDLACSPGADLATDDGTFRITVTVAGHVTCTATNTHSEWTADKTVDPVSGTTVEPGQTVVYTLHARLLKGPAVTDALVEDDLSGVLAHADLLGTPDASSGTADIDHEAGTLAWHIPRLTGDETLTYRVKVHDDAHGVDLINRLTTLTTTEPGSPPILGTPCEDVASAALHRAATAHCNRTDNPVEPGHDSTNDQAGGTLPDTGGPSLWWPAAGGLLLGTGVLLVMAARRQRRRA